MAQWFLIRNGKEHGPISDQQLKDLAAKGRIQPTEQIRRQDMANPVLAGAINGLFPKVVMAPMPPPLPQPAAPKPPQTTSAWPKSLRIILPVGVILIALVKFVAIEVKPRPPAVPPAAPVVQQPVAAPKIEIAKADPPPMSVPAIDLAKGRPQISDFIEYMKREEKLEIHGDGQDAAGTPFEFFNDELGTNCRIYVGGREEFGQNVSAILVEADEQLGAIVIATPLNLKQPVRRGNDLTSISSFIRTMLPQAEIRKIVSKHSLALGSGGEAKAPFGKASLSLSLRRNELSVVIFVDR